MGVKISIRKDTCDEDRRGGFDYLATAIIEQAVIDYCHSIRRLDILNRQLKEAEEGRIALPVDNPDIPKKRLYNQRYRRRPNHFKWKIREAEETLESCVGFFKSDWFRTISTLDADVILGQCNKSLREEGCTIPDFTNLKERFDYSYNSRAINIFDSNKNYIGTYTTIKEVCEVFDITRTRLKTLLDGYSKPEKEGYIFKYNTIEKR